MSVHKQGFQQEPFGRLFSHSTSLYKIKGFRENLEMVCRDAARKRSTSTFHPIKAAFPATAMLKVIGLGSASLLGQ